MGKITEYIIYNEYVIMLQKVVVFLIKNNSKSMLYIREKDGIIRKRVNHDTYAIRVYFIYNRLYLQFIYVIKKFLLISRMKNLRTF